MKSLEEFKNLVEEETSDYSKFDVLVRAGLANKAQMQRIHRILDKMQEDRPQFNNADKQILQNLFNRMVDLVSNNKQIFQKTRQAVREELEEDIVDTSDFKISPSGRKVRAHRIKIGDIGKIDDEDVDKKDIKESSPTFEKDPPFVLVLRRKAIRMYPNQMKVAIYHNDKLDKYFSVPYGASVDGPIQAEETDLEESVMDHLHKIVDEKQARTVKFANGKTRKVDGYTASAITQVHKNLNDENKKKIEGMVHHSPEQFEKVAAFAFKHVK